MVDSRNGSQSQRARARRRKKVTALLSKIEKTLKDKSTNATLADFIRLTQLERELEEAEQPREIIVTWVDPMAKEYIAG